MTTHCTPEELVDALDRPLTAGRDAHLAACADCARQLAELRRLMAEVTTAGVVPEPSPLFWNHLSARVREAVNAEPLPVAPWWGGWRTFATVAGVVGVIVLAVVLLTSRGGVVAPADVISTNAESTAASDETSAVWDMMASVAPSMAPEVIDEASWRPAPEATAAAIAALTNQQRQELMKLLRDEMRGSGASE